MKTYNSEEVIFIFSVKQSSLNELFVRILELVNSALFHLWFIDLHQPDQNGAA